MLLHHKLILVHYLLIDCVGETLCASIFNVNHWFPNIYLGHAESLMQLLICRFLSKVNGYQTVMTRHLCRGWAWHLIGSKTILNSTRDTLSVLALVFIMALLGRISLESFGNGLSAPRKILSTCKNARNHYGYNQSYALSNKWT